MLDTFPFCNLEKSELLELFITEIQYQTPKPTSKTRCGSCSKKVNKNVFIYCSSCKRFYHLYHFSLKQTDFPLSKDWSCNSCSLDELPFSSIADDNLLLTLKGFSDKTSELLSNLPSFSIKSLIDQLPGQKISTDEFLSNSIESKYFTPAQFLNEKFNKK